MVTTKYTARLAATTKSVSNYLTPSAQSQLSAISHQQQTAWQGSNGKAQVALHSVSRQPD